jgi:hypothetical protein
MEMVDPGGGNGLGTVRLANTARFDTRPENDARSIAFPPASATTNLPRSKRTSTALESMWGHPG